MAEEGQTQSIRDRIKAFNLAGTSGHLGRAPGTATRSDDNVEQRPLPTLRAQSASAESSHDQPRASYNIGNEPNGPRGHSVLPPPSHVTPARPSQNTTRPNLPPRLPSRKPPGQQLPALPPRRPSDQVSSRTSIESLASTKSSTSVITNGAAHAPASRNTSLGSNRIKAPPYDHACLPVLPQRRSTNGSQTEEATVSTPHSTCQPSSNTTMDVAPTADMMPSFPSRPPARPEQPPRPSRTQAPSGSIRSKPNKSALSFGMNKASKGNGHEEATQKGLTAASQAQSAASVPASTSTPPDINKLLATKPRPGERAPPPSCLLCRDFSIVDAHAAKFPRAQVPSIDWLAIQLTEPFPSTTDKARSIFTWLHHNVAYDTVSFFNGNVKSSTPNKTLQTGLAVCEGYAGLFTAIAGKVGLESIVVGGHGKGYGFASLQPGTAIPAENPSGHAWNAVKIDQGYWKLIDCCWGAGVVNGKGQPYMKVFNADMFTMANMHFGLKHYPQNRSHFFLEADGYSPPTWPEYFVGPLGGQEAVQVFTDAHEEGISDTTFTPMTGNISLTEAKRSGPTMRFQFAHKCDHWDPMRNGRGEPYVCILKVEGIDGKAGDYVPFETDGHAWWLDIEPRRLGRPGQTISAFTVDTVDGRSGRGLSVEDYIQAKGRKAMGFRGLAAWQLV